ncbi:MAG: hypothetical protein ACKVS8_08850 [Phycisphaerales bacterium]
MPLDNVNGMSEQELKAKGYWVSPWDGQVKGGAGGNVTSAWGDSYKVEGGQAKPATLPPNPR